MKPFPIIRLDRAADQKTLFYLIWSPANSYCYELTVDGAWAQWLNGSINGPRAVYPWMYSSGTYIRAVRDRSMFRVGDVTCMNSIRHFTEYLASMRQTTKRPT